MATVTPDSPENEIRRAQADAHRTVATIYDNTELPLLKWEINEFGQAYAFAWQPEQLDPFAGWLDTPHAGHNGTENYDHHWVTGLKEGVPIKVTCLIEFITSHAEMPRMIP